MNATAPALPLDTLWESIRSQTRKQAEQEPVLASFLYATILNHDTLEAALPRLREILADAGVTLGQAQVGSESAQSSSFGGEKGDNSRSPAGGEGPSAPPGAVVRGGDAIWMQRGRGLVDTFA